MIATITGIGWLTADGIGAGRRPAGFSVSTGPMPAVTREMAFPDPMPRFGRMDDLSRLGLSAMAMALKDAGCFEWSQKRSIGILAGTVYGCLHTDRAFFDTLCADSGQSPSPSLFAYTLPSCMLGEAAIVFGLTGPSCIVNDAGLTDITCIRVALENILSGDAGTVLCGVCDLGAPPFMRDSRKGLPGAIFFMLENHPDRSETVYGHLDLDTAGKVRFNGIETINMIELVEKCLDSAGRTALTGNTP
ncbi:MAG: beta-ketoacyl synthase [Deltaproteobacteria bacterium]|nr:MAG: beta-ketoacyl synthase [Deltaproteobacteria bacterium]